VPLLENPNAPWKEAVFSQRALDLDKAKYDDPQGRSVRTMKYHYNNWEEFGEELYDMKNDPHEYTNLATDAAYTDVLKHMRKLLSKFVAGTALTTPTYTKATYYRDADGDGYGTDVETTVAYFAPQGFAAKGGDCDDHNNEIYPGAKSCNADAASGGVLSSEKFSAFPNPTAGNLTVTYSTDKKSDDIYLNVYDMAGKLVYSKKEVARTGKNTYQLFLERLAAGAFNLELKSANGDVLQQAKFIIKSKN
jgi:hypothetical protein